MSDLTDCGTFSNHFEWTRTDQTKTQTPQIAAKSNEGMALRSPSSSQPLSLNRQATFISVLTWESGTGTLVWTSIALPTNTEFTTSSHQPNPSLSSTTSGFETYIETLIFDTGTGPAKTITTTDIFPAVGMVTPTDEAPTTTNNASPSSSKNSMLIPLVITVPLHTSTTGSHSTSKSQSTTTQPSNSSSTNQPPIDAKCGSNSNINATCPFSQFGSCCSADGFCGSSPEDCGDGCQRAYGSCATSNPTSDSTSPVVHKVSDGLAPFNGGKVVAMSMGGIVLLLLAILLGFPKHRRTILAKFRRHKGGSQKHSCSPSESMPLQDNAYISISSYADHLAGLAAKKAYPQSTTDTNTSITYVNSSFGPSSRLDITSGIGEASTNTAVQESVSPSLKRFIHDLALSSGGLQGGSGTNTHMSTQLLEEPVVEWQRTKREYNLQQAANALEGKPPPPEPRMPPVHQMSQAYQIPQAPAPGRYEDKDADDLAKHFSNNGGFI
ncbi:hypothetical protein BJ878DRAFT_575468 [Calycina marina]|uniref:Chitin-binding type-1 domain-containing protein n=1 Tax=Calycina marina TaxID=1763456 RepID=A0A9P8CFH7_9HELO|nr:hypothetical protein BJ878DRAFT_575468 [Calycina marina]